MNEELEACPFCGGTGHIIDKTLRDGYADFQDDPDAFAYNVRCLSCAATGGWRKSESGARREWNMRAGEKQLRAENERLREAGERALLNMRVMGNILNWPPEIPQAYADAINELQEALGV